MDDHYRDESQAGHQRVLLVGASGRIGQLLAPLLARLGVELGLAGTRPDPEREAAARALGARAVQIHPSDEDQITAELQNWDVLINVGGPEKVTVLPLLRSCIRSSTHYGDIAADTEVTLASLQLTEQAAAAGITALSGVGTSPAVSCLLARHAVEQLDHVDDLVIGYIYPVPEPAACPAYADGFSRGEGNASWQIELTAPLGSIDLVRDGQLTTTSDAWTDQVPLTFPLGPTVAGVPCNYPEVHLLHAKYPAVSNISMVVQFDSDAASTAWHRACQDLGSGRSLDEVGVDFFRTMAQDDNKNQQLVDVAKIPTINAIGTRAGQPARYCVRTAEWIKTENVAATMCALLLRGDLPTGVFTAEQVLDPQPFFQQVYAQSGEPTPEAGLLVDELVVGAAQTSTRS